MRQQKYYELLTQVIAAARRSGFDYVRDSILWPLHHCSKITDKQLLKAFDILHAKGF